MSWLMFTHAAFDVQSTGKIVVYDVKERKVGFLSKPPDRRFSWLHRRSPPSPAGHTIARAFTPWRGRATAHTSRLGRSTRTSTSGASPRCAFLPYSPCTQTNDFAAQPMKNIAIKNAGPGGVWGVRWVTGEDAGKEGRLVSAGADGGVRVWGVVFHV
jgi:hypothetical protein